MAHGLTGEPVGVNTESFFKEVLPADNGACRSLKWDLEGNVSSPH